MADKAKELAFPISTIVMLIGGVIWLTTQIADVKAEVGVVDRRVATMEGNKSDGDRHHEDFLRLEDKVDQMNAILIRLDLSDRLSPADDDRDDEQDERIKALENQ